MAGSGRGHRERERERRSAVRGGRPRGRIRDHRLLRRLQESLNTMRDGVFQGGQV